MCMFVFDKVKYLKREWRADPVLGLYILGVFRYINQRLSCTKTCPRHTDYTTATPETKCSEQFNIKFMLSKSYTS